MVRGPALVLALLSACAFAQQRARPNILFIFTDDHAAHSISAYGSAINRTPNIDRLAKEGMLFRNCFVGNAICAPSRASVLTGKHSHKNGLMDNTQEFDRRQQTFNKLLRQSGYLTALIGKWHLKSDPVGFDYYDILPGQGQYYNPDFLNAEGQYRVEGYVTDVITDKAVKWMEGHRSDDKPFLLMVQHKAPHRAWWPAERHLSLYEGRDVPEPVDLFDDWSGLASPARQQKMSIAKDLILDYDLKIGPAPERLNAGQRAAWEAAYGPQNAWFEQAGLTSDALVRYKYQRYIKDYLRCVAAVDDSVGAMLDYLEESGLAKDTVVVYSSDQGFFLGDYGWFDKRWMYEPSLRTPLLVKWPGVTAPGSVNEDLVQNIDFTETFLEVAGVPVPADMQGRSLVPLLKGDRPADWRRAIYYHYYEAVRDHNVPRHFGVRTDRYKLVSYYDTGEWEMFDLRRDPREKRNVYNDPAYAQTRSLMRRLLEAERRYYDDDTAPPVSVSAHNPLSP